MPPTTRAALAASFGIALGAALLAAPASAAHAQFGRLVKRAAAAAAGAAGGAAAGAAAERAGVAPAAGRAAEASLLEITPERLDAFVVGMRGPLEGARRRAAADAARERWEAAKAEYAAAKARRDACQKQAAPSAVVHMSDASMARYQRIGALLGPLAMRQAQAEAAADARLAGQLADSLDVLGAQLEALQFPEVAKRCGPPPRRAAAAPPAEPPAADDPAFRPALPAGMTAAQFGLLRERVAAWLVAADKRYSYAPQELQALEGRRAALAPLAPFFRDRSVEWRSVTAGFETAR